jgi:RimJ/RimL family protein N-acetyltransferase
MTTVPELLTPRLRLRAHRLEDFDPMVALWADPEVVRHIGGRPFRADETWARLMRYAGMWVLLGYGFWAVTDQESGTYLGDCGFLSGRRPITPPLPDVPEAGWAFVAAAHGRGIASEAVTAAHAWADEQRHRETVCIIDPGNRASIRVAEKLGYGFVDQRVLGDALTGVYRRSRQPG